MAIELNGISFSTGGTAVYNSVSLDKIMFGSTVVWEKEDPIIKDGVVYSTYTAQTISFRSAGWSGDRSRNDGVVSTASGFYLQENQYNNYCCYKFNTPVDLSSFNNVVVTANGACKGQSSGDWIYNVILIGLWDGTSSIKVWHQSGTTTVSGFYGYWKGLTMSGTHTFDISNLTGNGYIIALAGTSNGSNDAHLTITDITCS